MSLFQEFFSFFSASLQSLPFMLLAVLSYLGIRKNWARVLAIVWLLFIVINLAFSVLAMGWVGLVDLSLLTNPNRASPQGLSLAPDWGWRMATIVFGIGAAMVAGAMCYLEQVRHFLSRYIPLNPHSSVHTNALATVITISILSVLPLLALGQPPLLKLLAGISSTQANALDQSSMVRSTFYTLIWTVPCTIFSVGWLTQRRWGEALNRLGFVRPKLRNVITGVVVAVGLVVLVRLLSAMIDYVWGAMGWAKTDSESFMKLMAFALTPIGALIVAVTAGLGEELAVRGVLQPRLGILLSNLFFTSLHAFQYNFDALLVVFIIGTVMGFLRRRTNTTTSAIAHGVYDLILLVLTGMGLSN